MSSSSRPTFAKGDKVFAKVRGYPPWPARVDGTADETPNKMKYHVHFYGTGETAVVKGEDIFPYIENKLKLGKPKKHKNFTEALHQIENELSPEQKQKLFDLESNSHNHSANISNNDSTFDDSEKKSSTAVKVKNSASPSLKNVKPKEKKRKLDESNSDDNEKKRSVSASNSDGESKAEVLSRSGRKIKPKRFADYENDSGEESHPIAKPISKVAPRINPDFESEKSAVADDSVAYVTAYVNQDKVKIPLDVEKPPTLDPEAEELWNTKVRNYATQLKRRLEAGEIFPISVQDHMYQWGREQARKAVLINSKPADFQDPKQEHMLTEGVMLELDLAIRAALNVRQADTARCIELLDQLIELQLTPLMLKKHPDIVQTIKKVRRYIGNVPTAFSEEQEQNFHKEAEIIRAKAEVVYCKFQSLFHVPSHKSFWEYFEHEKDYFYHQTKDMTTEEIINLVDEVY